MTAKHFDKERPDGRKVYLPKVSVLDAARKRLEWAFDRFANVIVCVSGGKDSTVLLHLAHAEAQKRERPLHLFFLDQEAEYQATIDLMRQQMALPGVVPHWYQVPCHMTNATSYEDELLYAWEPGAQWVRDKEPDSIHDAPEGAPSRFYPFMEWFESQWGADTCLLIGLRSEESLNRFGAVTRNPALPGINWSSKGKGAAIKLYPLYDWAFEDIWTYLGKFKVPYNRVYDWLWAKGKHIPEYRVSNLIHEKAYKSLVTLQEFEHETFERLSARLKGVHTAALYGGEATVFSTRQKPESFATWRDYRDFLLDTYPGSAEHVAIFRARFADQEDSEATHRQQVRQLLLNDFENSIPIDQGRQERAVLNLNKWKDLV